MDNFIYRYILSDIGRVLWDSFLNHPDEWEVDEGRYTLDNHDKEISLWIANGAAFFDGYMYMRTDFSVPRKYTKEKVKLGYLERHFLYRKCRLLITVKKSKIEDSIIERFTQ